LRDDLVGADEQDHLPLRPVADAVDLPKNDAEEDDLAGEPEHFHDHPKNEIGLEAQLADEGVAQHDSPDFKVTPHADDLFWRSARIVNSAKHRNFGAGRRLY
jgi:hypothetical protein